MSGWLIAVFSISGYFLGLCVAGFIVGAKGHTPFGNCSYPGDTARPPDCSLCVTLWPIVAIACFVAGLLYGVAVIVKKPIVFAIQHGQMWHRKRTNLTSGRLL